MQSYYEAIYNNFGSLSMKQQVMLNDQYLLINVDHDKIRIFQSAFKKHFILKIKQSNIIQNY
jgi:hypothetical protein